MDEVVCREERDCATGAEVVVHRGSCRCADGGAATAKTGVVRMLTVGVTILLKRINERLKKVRRRCNKTVPSCRNHDF